MLCDNCGKREANVIYSENINGVKKELHLCEQCSQKLGIANMNFTIPTDFSSLFGDFIEGFTTSEFMPLFQEVKEISCDQCGTTFEDIVNNGKLGCGNCYSVFEEKLDPILKRIQGNVQHVGRIGKITPNEVEKVKKDVNKAVQQNMQVAQNNKNQEIETLQEKLKQAIKEERYEDAAKIRDEIKQKENKEEEG